MNSTFTNLERPSPLAFAALGDSYGFGFEMTTPEFVKAHNMGFTHVQHPHFTKVQPGVYSDDTQMMLALAEVMISGEEWSPQRVAQSFLDVFHRDQRAGYAERFHEFLLSVRHADEFIERIRNDSERNGAAMRAPVLGLYPSLEKVKSLAEMQAKLTHNTEGGIDSAIAAALMAHYFAFELGPTDELPAFLSRHLPRHHWTGDWEGEVPVHGMSTVHAALTAILQSDSLASLLKNCVAFTGDVDSVATIALASASGSARFANDIPESLWSGVEQGTYGLSYLIDLDKRVRLIMKNKPSFIEF